MGCSQSLNSEVHLAVDLNAPIFKSTHVKHSIAVRSSLREFCKQVINLHQDNEYHNQEVLYKISVKGRTFSIDDCVSLYELRIAPEDTIKITGSVMDNKKIELTLRICCENPKTIIQKFTRATLVKDLLNCQKGLLFVRGDLMLDPESSLDEYNICNKSKLTVLVDGAPTEEIQIWKIKKTGLVLEATCMNPDCMAYKQRICLNLGLGQFEMQTELCDENERECVCCSSKLSRISRIGFCHCQATIEDISEEKVMKIADYADYPLPNDLRKFKVRTERLMF
jgi:hypothetical protein